MLNVSGGGAVHAQGACLILKTLADEVRDILESVGVLENIATRML